MSNKKNKNEELEAVKAELTKAREMLHLTTETLNDERRVHALKKNKVQGGFYMMSRAAEKNLRALQKENATASLVFSFLREHMAIGTNAVTVSNEALAAFLSVSTRTIVRAVKHLKDNRYVQVIKVGSTNSYIVNEQIAFSGRAGQRSAVFSAMVIAHELEQEEGFDQVKKLKATPIILNNERAIVGTDELPPPDQADLDLN